MVEVLMKGTLWAATLSVAHAFDQTKDVIKAATDDDEAREIYLAVR
jgi:hypothetical protein